MLCIMSNLLQVGERKVMLVYSCTLQQIVAPDMSWVYGNHKLRVF